MHMMGGMSLAATRARFEMLKAEKSRFDVMGMDTRIIGPDEIRALCPIVDTTGVIGALYDHQEGYVDPRSPGAMRGRRTGWASISSKAAT